MASALPKIKHRPQWSQRRVPSLQGLPRRLKLLLGITVASFLFFSSLRVITGKMLGITRYLRDRDIKEFKVLQQTAFYLQEELAKLTSPKALEERAKSKNMSEPQKVYHLKLENL